MKTLLFALFFVLERVVPYLVQRWDRARLRPEQRAAAWNSASWGSAIWNFGVLSMLAWVWVTRLEWSRRRRAGLLVALAYAAWVWIQGAVATVVIAAALLAVVEGMAAWLDVALD